MPLSSMELIRAREAVQHLLDELRIAAYRFEVEPGNDGWRLIIECAFGQRWQTTTLKVPADALDGRNPDAEGELRRELSERLSLCRE